MSVAQTIDGFTRTLMIGYAGWGRTKGQEPFLLSWATAFADPKRRRCRCTPRGLAASKASYPLASASSATSRLRLRLRRGKLRLRTLPCQIQSRAFRVEHVDALHVDVELGGGVGFQVALGVYSGDDVAVLLRGGEEVHFVA